MDTGDRHPLATRLRLVTWASSLGAWIARREMVVIRAADSLSPNSIAFFRVNRPPTGRDRSVWDQKITAGFLFQRLSRGPNAIPESGILQQIFVAFLPHQCRVVSHLPMHD